MTKVISESNYSYSSNKNRVASVSSQRSIATTSNKQHSSKYFKRTAGSQLGDILSRKSHQQHQNNPGSSHK